MKKSARESVVRGPQLVINGVPAPEAAPRKLRKRRPLAAVSSQPCNVCGGAVSERSTYTQCLVCRGVARAFKAAMLQATRRPDLQRMLEEQIGMLTVEEAPAVLALLQALSNRLRHEARA